MNSSSASKYQTDDNFSASSKGSSEKDAGSAMEAENNFVEETSSKMKLSSMGAGGQHGGVEGIAQVGWCEHRVNEFQAFRLEQAVLEQEVVGLTLGDKRWLSLTFILLLGLTLIP